MLVQNSGSTEKPGQSQTPNAWQGCQRSTLEQRLAEAVIEFYFQSLVASSDHV